jgi:hypothetical protein
MQQADVADHHNRSGTMMTKRFTPKEVIKTPVLEDSGEASTTLVKKLDTNSERPSAEKSS